MNLYKILVKHFAPKDNKTSIACLLLANNDNEVYEWFDTNPSTEELNIYSFTYNLEDEEEIKEYKKRMIKLHGEIFDEDLELNDLFYGKTIFGWELLKENVDINNYNELIELNIIKKHELSNMQK